MESESKKYHRLKEHFPSLFNFLQWCLPWEKVEEWIGDVDETLNEKAKEKQYSRNKIKWMYILEILPIFHSARKMGYLRGEKLIPELLKKKGFKKNTSAGSSAEGGKEANEQSDAFRRVSTSKKGRVSTSKNGVSKMVTVQTQASKEDIERIINATQALRE